MKKKIILLILAVFLVSASCASAPQGPSKPGMPWIFREECPNYVQMGDMARVAFRYQGDELPDYAEISAIKLSILEPEIRMTTQVRYLYEDKFEILLKLGSNPTTWKVTFFVVDRKGRYSNELSCQLAIR